MNEQRPVVAIDLGGTKAFVGVVQADGLVRVRTVVPSRDLKDRPAALLDRLAETTYQVIRDGGLSEPEVAGVGICVPGPLDLTRSVVSLAPNLGWDDLPVRGEMEQRLPGLPVFLENDVRAAALGEHVLGAGRGYRSMLAVFVGTGVGGGLIVNGRLYHGGHGGAGEIGHMVLKAGGPRCGCGRFGCLEALAARAAVGRYAAREVARGFPSVLTEMLQGDLSQITSRDLARAIDQGDRVAIHAARHSARYTGLGIGSVMNVVDPEIVVIGGGIAEAYGQRYVDAAAELARRQVLSDTAKKTPIVASLLGDEAGLLGAALTAFNGLEGA